MASPVPLTQDIFWVGVNDRDTDLFESIWPLPRGVTYNSYLIRDTRTALVDTVKKPFFDEYAATLTTALQGRALDYVIVNHMEPDHSGALAGLQALFPGMQIIGNEKTAGFLKHFYGIERNVRIVKDGEEVSLGRHRLSFHLTPMVHWPETMMTFDHADRVLFSADAFGGFGSLDDGLFDDEVDPSGFEDETRRYFSNIVAKYSAMVLKALATLSALDTRIVASTHGLIYRKDPGRIIGLYRKWSSYESEPGVVVVCGSMYGNTRAMADVTVRALRQSGLDAVTVHDASRTHLSFIVNDAWKYSGLLLAAPTYNTTLFPPVDHVVTFLDHAGIRNRSVGILESHGWSGGASARMKDFVTRNRLRLVEPVVEARCAPTAEDLARCASLGKELAAASMGP